MKGREGDRRKAVTSSAVAGAVPPIAAAAHMAGEKLVREDVVIGLERLDQQVHVGEREWPIIENDRPSRSDRAPSSHRRRRKLWQLPMTAMRGPVLRMSRPVNFAIRGSMAYCGPGFENLSVDLGNMRSFTGLADGARRSRRPAGDKRPGAVYVPTPGGGARTTRETLDPRLIEPDR